MCTIGVITVFGRYQRKLGLYQLIRLKLVCRPVNQHFMFVQIRCYDGDDGDLLWDFDGHEDYLNRILVDPVASTGRSSRRKKVGGGRVKSYKTRSRSRSRGRHKITQREKFFRMTSMVGLDSLDRSASIREKKAAKRSYASYMSGETAFGDPEAADAYVRVFTAGREGLIRSWDIDTGKSLGVFGNAASKRRGLLHSRVRYKYAPIYLAFVFRH